MFSSSQTWIGCNSSAAHWVWKITVICFPALCSPGKISLVVEPAVSLITNQVDSLQKKGIQAIALGRAAGSSKSANYHWVFENSNDEPIVAFCTLEYLFGTPATSTFVGTKGQFCTILSKKEKFCLITIDESHKIFDHMNHIALHLMA